MLQLYAWISNEGDFLKFLSQHSYILLCSSTYTVLKKNQSQQNLGNKCEKHLFVILYQKNTLYVTYSA